MLGFIGFSIVGLILTLYAFSSENLSLGIKPFKSQTYSLAYLTMATAMFAWAAGTQIQQQSLRSAVLLGDILFLISTLLLLRVVTPKKYMNATTVLFAIISAILLYYRSKDVTSVMSDGVLKFYTPRWFGAVLIVVIYFIWLRANMLFYNTVILRSPKLNVLKQTYLSANITGFVGVCGFLFARKAITISIAFSMLGIAFLILLAVNFYAFELTQGKTHNAAR